MTRLTIIYFTSLVLLFLSFVSCSKMDKTVPPVVQVLGPNPAKTLIHMPYIDEYGVYVYHNSEVQIHTLSTSVNTTCLGSYVQTYCVTDEYDNCTDVDRCVQVYADHSSYAGVWSVDFTDSSHYSSEHLFLDSITASLDSTLIFHRFANIEFSKIYGYVYGCQGDSIFVPRQEVIRDNEVVIVSGCGFANASLSEFSMFISEEYNFVDDWQTIEHTAVYTNH